MDLNVLLESTFFNRRVTFKLSYENGVSVYALCEYLSWRTGNNSIILGKLRNGSSMISNFNLMHYANAWIEFNLSPWLP